ncbi:MAG TPA: lipocalin family protein [Mucilaginibacter sp.]|jgi:apolipoprotein D and lipocalin family protein|nr:lipocalin family protein [Mucilaginibacter sp.]
MEKKEKWLVALAAGAAAAGVTYALWPKSKIPRNAIVQPFDKQKYMGLWHEVARLPNNIQKKLKNLTDEYSLNADGSIKVVTRAYDFDKNKPVEATARGRFVGPGSRGKIKVAYVLPIYLDYNILDIDDGYNYALVSGNSLNHLWIISRDNAIPAGIRERFLAKATSLGFDVSKLEWM